MAFKQLFANGGRGERIEFGFFALFFRFRTILGALSYYWIVHLFLNDYKPVFVRFEILCFLGGICGLLRVLN